MPTIEDEHFTKKNRKTNNKSNQEENLYHAYLIIRQDGKKSLISTLACFLIAIVKV